MEKNASIFSNVLKLMSDENHFDIIFRREPLKEKRVEMPEKIEKIFLKYILDNKIKKSSFNNEFKKDFLQINNKVFVDANAEFDLKDESGLFELKERDDKRYHFYQIDENNTKNSNLFLMLIFEIRL